MLNKNKEIITIAEVEKLIETIKSIDRLDSYNSYTYILNLLNRFIIPCPPVLIPKGKKFIRGRVHKNNEKYFNKITDVSYRRDEINILNFGRANEPHQSVFYCSDDERTAINETFTVAREQRDIEFEEITWSVWELTRDIELVYVIGNPDKRTPNSTVNDATDVFLEKIKQSEFGDIKNQVLLFHKFISDSFVLRAKGHNTLYKISCAFANYIYNHSFKDSYTGKDLMSSGIMYASSICPEFGMNIALKPEIVDGCLKIVGAQKARMVRKNHSGFYIEKETSIAKGIDIEHNNIYW